MTLRIEGTRAQIQHYRRHESIGQVCRMRHVMSTRTEQTAKRGRRQRPEERRRAGGESVGSRITRRSRHERTKATDCGVEGDKRKPQATLPGGSGPVPLSFRRAQHRYINAAMPFQLLPAGPLAFPLSSIAWGISYGIRVAPACQVLLPPRHLLEQRATEQTRAQTEAGHTSKRGY